VNNNNLWLCDVDVAGCTHNKMNQKGCYMGPKINQDWRNIYVLPFKTMAIIAN
jgi:hypothetical protein